MLVAKLVWSYGGVGRPERCCQGLPILDVSIATTTKLLRILQSIPLRDNENNYSSTHQSESTCHGEMVIAAARYLLVMDNDDNVGVVLLALDLAALLLLFQTTMVFLYNGNHGLTKELCCGPTDNNVGETPPYLGAVCVQQTRDVG